MSALQAQAPSVPTEIAEVVLPLEQAKAADRAARQAYGEARLALSAAIDDVRRFHAPLIEAARESAAVAAQQLAASESSAAPNHEWEGRAVTGPKGTWGIAAREMVSGVVFTYRPGVDLGRGHSYSRPDVGEPLVRLFRKGGSPGATTVRLNEGFSLSAGEP